MEIPYTVTARPDTGLYNSKLGIWLFLASEVMLFGGLFSAYIFARMSADPGYWPTGLLNVPVGTMNTAILIASSVTVILSWAALKMRCWNQYVMYMGITIACAFIFLGVKLGFEWPDKFHHFGVFIKTEAAERYDQYLGNIVPGKPVGTAREITGHLEQVIMEVNGQKQVVEVGEHEHHADEATHGEHATAEHAATPDLPVIKIAGPGDLAQVVRSTGGTVKEYLIKLDATSAEPLNPKNQGAAFWPRKPPTDAKPAHIAAADVQSASAFYPRHSAFFQNYFLITGLHGLHVLGGALVFCYMLFFGKKLYLRNPEHLANRVEVAGLFWHFVDLVWIFVFPIFYLL